jgi:WD40 repeat protein
MQWIESLWCVQVKGFGRVRKLVACLLDEDRVVMQALDTSNQKVLEIERPWRCTFSLGYTAVATARSGVFVFTPDGGLDHIIPDSIHGTCLAFHPRIPDCLAIGFHDGSLCVWALRTRQLVLWYKACAERLTNIRFESDGNRLFLSSYETAFIVQINNHTHVYARVELKGHTDWVNDILPLPSSNKCVTCSDDKTMKVWDFLTGECMKTLRQGDHEVLTLAPMFKQPKFAGGSRNHSVIFWSSETFEVLHRIDVSNRIQSVAFAEDDRLFVGVYDQGVMTFNTSTFEAGPLLIPTTGSVYGLALGMLFMQHCNSHTLTHFSPAVPSHQPWTSSTHALGPSSTQHSVHVAVAVLWKVRVLGQLMRLPYELMEIVLRHLV